MAETLSPGVRDRIIDFRRVRAGDLLPNEMNWRRHPESQGAALRSLLDEVGYVGALVARETPGGLRLIDGHLRSTLTPDQEVPVVVVDVNDDEERLLIASYDPIGAAAERDNEKLGALLAEVMAPVGALRELLAELKASATPPNWRDLSDTSRQGSDTAEDHYGYDGASVWPRTGDNDTRAAPYYVSLPVNPGHSGDGTPGKEKFQQRYSRSPFREMENIVRTYMEPGDRFLESCAGWWTFSTMAAAWGYSGAGIDLWDVSIGFGRKQLAALPAGCGAVEIHKGDAAALPWEDDEFDFAYCNPPFRGIEVYSTEEGDLSSMDESAWDAATVRVLAELKRVVKPGGLIVTVMADVREAGYLLPLHIDWIALARRAGLTLWDLAVQPLQTQGFMMWRKSWEARRTIKAHEYVITFVAEGTRPAKRT